MTNIGLLKKLYDMGEMPIRIFNKIGRAGGFDSLTEEQAENLVVKFKVVSLIEKAEKAHEKWVAKQEEWEKNYVPSSAGREDLSMADAWEVYASKNSGTGKNTFDWDDIENREEEGR